jgi:subtilisin family serine protease
MRRRIVLLAVAAAALMTVLVVPAQAGGSQGADRYIVVLKSAVDSNAVANLHSVRYGANVEAVWSAALHGYAAVIPNDRVAALRADPNVAYVETDGIAYATAQTTPWGILKIGADKSSQLSGNGSGAVANVDAYVIDTGIDNTHPDLNVVQSVNFANGPNKDCNGHGSHVAGTIGARDDANGVVGVAPGIRLHAVRVLGCGGSGSWTGVISGIDWVTAHAIKPAIANMSLGGSANAAVDDAVRGSAGSGVFYSLAAGNDGGNACNQSPARAGAGTNNGIATVAATDSNDNEASWSNYGPCVDIWAPGVSIYSTYKGGGYATLSGTSMASPHVGGGGALWLSTHSGSATQVEAALKSAAQSTGTTSKNGAGIRREYVGTGTGF